MHYHTIIRCPHCGKEFIDVYCKFEFPLFYVPFVRCNICGNLVGTGHSEFLMVSPNDRQTYCKPTLENCKAIAESLDRMNNKEYVAFLKSKGYEIYPVTEEDKVKFKNVNFDKYENALPSEKATKMLYDAGVLIEEEKRDELTGGYKKEILKENQQQYLAENKAGNWSIAITIISMIILMPILGSTLDVAGILLGLFGGFAIGGVAYYLIKRSYDSRIRDNSISQEKYNNQDANNEIIEQQTDDDSEDDDISYEELDAMKDKFVNTSKSVLDKLYNAGAISDDEYTEMANKIKDIDNLSHMG